MKKKGKERVSTSERLREKAMNMDAKETRGGVDIRGIGTMRAVRINKNKCIFLVTIWLSPIQM